MAVAWLFCLETVVFPGLLRGDDAPRETRAFKILVDGKERGKLKMTVGRRDDHEIMTSEAEVRVNYFVYNYVYTSRGTEIWKAGRLRKFNNTANYNGKHYAVQAVAKENGLAVKVNGQERVAHPDIWLTSFWRLPAAKFRNQSVPLMDADKGHDIQGKLKYVGMSPINVGGKMQKCAHYRVTGGIEADLWYDQQDRMVRQESVESGHSTTMELTDISVELNENDDRLTVNKKVPVGPVREP